MKKPLPPARRHLRRVLYAMLFLSFLFAGTATTTYALVRTKTISIRDISPVLFEADIASYKLKALFQTEEQQYKAALRMLNSIFFSPQYEAPSREMIRNLAYKDYEPAQFVHANIIMLTAPNGHERGEAMMFYQDAADAGYEPARQKLVELARLEPLRDSGL